MRSRKAGSGWVVERGNHSCPIPLRRIVVMCEKKTQRSGCEGTQPDSKVSLLSTDSDIAILKFSAWTGTARQPADHWPALVAAWHWVKYVKPRLVVPGALNHIALIQSSFWSTTPCNFSGWPPMLYASGQMSHRCNIFVVLTPEWHLSNRLAALAKCCCLQRKIPFVPAIL